MMTSSSINDYTLPSSTDSLLMIENIVEKLRLTHQISEEIYGNILVSLTEAINNALKHGNQFHKEKKIQFGFEPSESELVFTVIDEGEGFDYESIPDPTLPENIEKVDGRGIFIMKSLADNVTFENEGRSVKISFVK